MMIRSYSELLTLSTFEQRLEYLKLRGSIGVATFDNERWLNQEFYNSWKWRSIRKEIIIRDNACDLAIPGRDIFDAIRIHHMNPITIEDLESLNPIVYDPEYLICTSLLTHNAIHFDRSSRNRDLPIERRKGDTKLW